MANLELTHTHDPCLQKSFHEEWFKLLALILKKKNFKQDVAGHEKSHNFREALP